jgi:hypothetical protein
MVLVWTLVEEPRNNPLAPLDGAVNVTVTPLNKFPPLSCTEACRFVPNVLPMIALWFDPTNAVIDAAAPVRFVKLKLAVTEPAFAVTVYGPPAVLLAVNVGAVATPLALVITVAVTPVPGAANVPLAPLDGAVKVTDTPSNGFELLSFTVTESAVNAVLIATLWGVVLALGVMDAGVPAELVRLKFAGVAGLAVAATV